MLVDDDCVLTVGRWLRLQLLCLNGLMDQSEASSILGEEGRHVMLFGWLSPLFFLQLRPYSSAKAMHSGVLS
jgi:hypothetical protein